MKLDHLDQEKQNKIIEALLDEYSAEGLENASTNRIVKAAGISKGSLFNYLGNKVDQYLFLLTLEIERLMVVLNQYMIEMPVPKDYFDQLLNISRVKIKISLEYPRENRLLFNAYIEKNERVKAYMDQQYNMIATQALDQHKQMLDPNLLINPDDRDKVVEMIFHFVSGYSDNYLKRYESFENEDVGVILEDIMIELDGYFDMMRRSFFK